MAWILAECTGGVLEIIVPRRPTVSASAGYEPKIGLGVASRWKSRVRMVSDINRVGRILGGRGGLLRCREGRLMM